MTYPRIVRLTALLFCVALICSCELSSSESLHKSARFLMGTFVEVTVKGPKSKANQAIEAVFDEMKRVEDVTSFHKPSQLTSVNQSAGSEPIQTAPELVALIARSLAFADDTDGAFDPTLGPLAKLWHFSAGEPRLPEHAEIMAALEKKGWEAVKVNESLSTVSVPRKGMLVDLGGIAKGYALERARAVLKRLGISAALINAGGDILAMGEKSPGKPWRIGVQDPRSPRGLVAVATLKDNVIVTSGDYERFFMKDGKRYHHILNPKTGYPAEGLQSATIVAEDGVTADAVATAVFSLGVKKGLKYVEKIPDAEGFLIDSSGKLHMTSGASSFLEITR